jgi:Fe-S-cluster containining protein
MKDWLKFCENCESSCCGLFPLPAKLFNRHQHKAQKPYRIVETADHIIPLTEDGWCIFLNDKKRCVIYNDRPNICRMYGEIPNPRLQCSRMRGEPDDFVGEAISASEHANYIGLSLIG